MIHLINGPFVRFRKQIQHNIHAFILRTHPVGILAIAVARRALLDNSLGTRLWLPHLTANVLPLAAGAATHVAQRLARVDQQWY